MEHITKEALNNFVCIDFFQCTLIHTVYKCRVIELVVCALCGQVSEGLCECLPAR